MSDGKPDAGTAGTIDVPRILPIRGTGSVGHRRDDVAAAGIALTPAEVASLTGAG